MLNYRVKDHSFGVHGKFQTHVSRNQVDQCFTVWRNKKKEQTKQAGKEVDEKMPDAFVVCDKNRHGDWEGKVGLFYNPGACSYSEHPGRMTYYNYDRYMGDEGVAI